MSSRLKERGGGGGGSGKALMTAAAASKLQKALPDGTPKDKVIASRRTPISGKENQRSVSCGKSSVPRQRPLPVAALDPVKKPVLVPAGVRWSTSSMPRSRSTSSTSTNMSDLRVSRGVPGPDPSGRSVGRDLERAGMERKGFSGIRVLERCQQQKKGLIPSPNCYRREENKANGGVRVAENCRTSSVSASHLGKIGSRVSGMSKERAGAKAANGSLSSEDHGMESSHVSGINLKRTCEKGLDREAQSVNMESRNKTSKCNAIIEISNNKPCLVPFSKSAVDKTCDCSESSGSCRERECLVFNIPVNGKVASTVANAPGNDKEKDRTMSSLKGLPCKSEIGNGILEISGGKTCAISNSKPMATGKVLEGITVFESLNELKENAKDERVVKKYPSKLHEKLALLEGKVQRIATDIKRTKEMLDSNNPDASKMILADIQDKILGIEKAVVCVVDGTEGEIGQTKSVTQDNVQLRDSERIPKEKGQAREFGDSNNSVKALNNEELEARFFPHHRLLRNRTIQDTLEGKEKISNPAVATYDGHPVTKDGSESPIDENPVAMEFLASLNADHSKMSTRDRATRAKFAAILEMGSDSESVAPSAGHPAPKEFAPGHHAIDVALTSNEKLDEFDDRDNKTMMVVKEESDDTVADQLFSIGHKPSTGGWFVSDGEAVLLAHSDGTCSYYDVANTEEKAQYMPPPNVSQNLWGDCWLVRAPGADGCAGRYVVAASAGNTAESGFCSWDFYKKDIQAFRLEGTPASFSAPSSSRTVLAPPPTVGSHRSSLCAVSFSDNRKWWYRPCGYLIASASSQQSVVSAYDVRDGSLVMTWGVQSPILAMEYSSPLQWRSRGKLIIAERDAISLWDVNSLNPQPLLSVATAGKKILALHVNNTDAELGGGVRQRVSSSEAEGNDGVFCTQDGINVFDLRLPSRVGLKISKPGSTAQSIYSRGDSILVGSNAIRANGGTLSGVQHFSLRKGKLIATYVLPDRKAHSLITQVWGNSNLVMGICREGLFVFNPLKDGGVQSFAADHNNMAEASEAIGSGDLHCPSFDYLGERVLVISRDRPASWRYLS